MTDTATKKQSRLNTENTGLPSFWRFVWMFFMQPISLHYRLKSVGIDPDASGWKLVKNKKNKKVIHQFLKYQVILLCVLMPIFVVLIALLLQFLGVEISWKKLAGGVAFGVAFGVVFGISFGISFGIAFGIAFGITFGITSDVTGGVTFGVIFRLPLGTARGVIWFLFLFLFFVIISVIIEIMPGTEGAALWVIWGTYAWGSFLFIHFRLWAYPPEIILQSIAYFIRKPPYSLIKSPIFYHDSYFPYPFLGKIIKDTALNYPSLARKALDRCAIIPGQKRIGKKTLVRLQINELQAYFQQQEFEAIYELKGEWLPARSPENPESLRQISEVGRYLLAYQNAIQSQQQLQHLQKAADQLQGLQNQFLSRGLTKNKDWASLAAQPLKTWQAWIESEIKEIKQQTSHEIPNPFYYGRPISPEYGTGLFRGREKIARHIEQLLADQQQSLSIALLAPRRCGKSSMLKMLPSLLPDAIFIFYDLQDNAVDSIEGFFRSLVKRVQEQAYQDRGIKIPDLPEGTAFEAGSAWLEQVDKQLKQTMLICIDEFERLPALFPGTKQQLLQLMSLFRATIQHRQHIRLLVSGAAPFDELENIWNDNFINVQEIKLPHLDYDSSIGLIRKPVDNFPQEAIPEALADAIFQRSNGQPFLLQAFAGITIDHLNNNKLKAATLDMLDNIEAKVMECCVTYFRDVYGSAPEAAKLILQKLSKGKTCEIDKTSKRWLKRRLLINQQDEIKIPIFGRWVREFAEEF